MDTVNSNGQFLNKTISSLFIIAVWLAIFFGFDAKGYVQSLLQFVLLYVVTIVLFNAFKRNRLVRFGLKMLWMPGIFLIAFYPFLLAILSVVLSYAIVYMLTYLMFEVLPVDLFHYHFTKALNIYLEITISSFLVSYYYDKFVSIWEYVFIRRREHKQLTYKIMNQSRAKFSIYFLYFIALLVLNISRLNGKPLFASPLLERAVLESFGTFLAFERIITNWKLFMEEKSAQ